jgi:hypothetical protein
VQASRLLLLPAELADGTTGTAAPDPAHTRRMQSRLRYGLMT